jgi:hypothetical protein
MKQSLRDIAVTLPSAVEKRLFAEYGAVFVTLATAPPTILFANAAEVEAFQATLPINRTTIGDYQIELQEAAMQALLAARRELEDQGLTLTPRAQDSARRSYEETVSLWQRNVNRGMEHWQAQGRMDSQRAALLQALAPVDQVALILELEEHEQIFFGTFFNRSILYSVAAPGASQHLSMLAFDVYEYRVEAVETALNRYGWFRTVIHDLPHFTYLGRREAELPQLGLKRIAIDYGELPLRFWVPDVADCAELMPDCQSS